MSGARETLPFEGFGGASDAFERSILASPLLGGGLPEEARGHLEAGREAAEKLLELDPRDRIGAQVLIDVLDRMEDEEEADGEHRS